MKENDTLSVKERIKFAFLELLSQKPYLDITVTDVVNQAEVARMSFYRNFSSTNDVLDLIVKDMIKEFDEEMIPALQSKDERQCRNFLFHYFYRLSKKQTYLAIKNEYNGSIVFSRMQSFVYQKESLSSPPMTLQEKYGITGKLSLLNEIAKKWLMTGMQETPEEIIDYIMTFITTI